MSSIVNDINNNPLGQAVSPELKTRGAKVPLAFILYACFILFKLGKLEYFPSGALRVEQLPHGR